MVDEIGLIGQRRVEAVLTDLVPGVELGQTPLAHRSLCWAIGENGMTNGNSTYNPCSCNLTHVDAKMRSNLKAKVFELTWHMSGINHTQPLALILVILLLIFWCNFH